MRKKAANFHRKGVLQYLQRKQLPGSFLLLFKKGAFLADLTILHAVKFYNLDISSFHHFK